MKNYTLLKRFKNNRKLVIKKTTNTARAQTGTTSTVDDHPQHTFSTIKLKLKHISAYTSPKTPRSK